MTRRGDFITTYSGTEFWPLDPRPEEILVEDIAHALSHVCRWTGHVSEFYSVAQHSVLVSLLVERWLTNSWDLKRSEMRGCDICRDNPIEGHAPPRAVSYGENPLFGLDDDHLFCELHTLQAPGPGVLSRAIDAELVRTMSLAALLHDGSEAYLADVARPVKHLPEMAAYRAAEHVLQSAIYARFGLDANEPLLVKEADNALLVFEAHDLFGPHHPVCRYQTLKEKKGFHHSPIRAVGPVGARGMFRRRFEELTA